MNPLPSEVLLLSIPLTGTFGRSEREIAAALIVRACQLEGGDVWRPVQTMELVRVATNDPVMRRLVSNPFLRPDVRDLVEAGFARWAKIFAVEFTQLGIERLRKWVPNLYVYEHIERWESDGGPADARP